MRALQSSDILCLPHTKGLDSSLLVTSLTFWTPACIQEQGKGVCLGPLACLSLLLRKLASFLVLLSLWHVSAIA